MAVELEPKHKRARTRSPSYPYLALPDALEKAAALWRAESRHAVSVSVAMQHWGYKAESSTGFSCIAALKKFALVDEEGVGEHREVKLSDLALSIILDEAGSPERKAALSTAALSPRIHAELWERYGADLPSDQSLKRFLVVEKNFNEASVEEFLAEYRATIAFAELTAANGKEGIRSEAPPATTTRIAQQPPGLWFADENPGSRGTPVPARPKVEIPRTNPSGVDQGAPVHHQARTPGSLTAGGKTAAPPSPHQSSAGASGASRPGAEPAAENNHQAGSETPKELLVPLENDRVVRVPYPMSEEDFDLFIDTLQLWKKRLVRPGGG